MIMTLTFILLINVTLLILIKMIPLVNLHKILDREKKSPFECGFDPFSNARMSFSIHFFSVSLMFLIFDIEITLILPLPLIKSNMKMAHWILFSFFMVFVLITGLMMEWKEGSMEWK
uniref:NADH-ubiquinone oxidoreductase chain 3 n=1 Tax=Paratrioza sinica TaxID=1511640 RepID=A0A068EVR0_9HEMI|nr:NADH dehydrogenase subunit 3 [Paratrioza sinica]AID54950.1 NADH dehydrogenase subunit 3 [Paratrioza sinica]